jgi:hypothetical protein
VDELRIQKRCREQLRIVVHQFSEILAEQAEQLRDEAPIATERMTILLGTVLKLSQSGRAILYLGRIGAIDEMNVLLRTQVELVVNACYLK